MKTISAAKSQLKSHHSPRVQTATNNAAKTATAATIANAGWSLSAGESVMVVVPELLSVVLELLGSMLFVVP
jgi:hypothetical protein